MRRYAASSGLTPPRSRAMVAAPPRFIPEVATRDPMTPHAHPRFARTVWHAALLLGTATRLRAQGTIPPFPLGTSPIALSGDARPGTYVSAVGRRSIAM